MSLSENYVVTLDAKNNLAQLPDNSMQVRKKSNSMNLSRFRELQTTQKTLIPPFQKLMVQVRR